MPRKDFPKSVKREALKRSGGLCEASGSRYGLEKDQRCNAPLSLGCHFDHDTADSLGGKPILDNCRSVCVSCHGWKTRNIDVPEAAKTKRISDKHKGISRPKRTIPNRGWGYEKKKPLIDKSVLKF